jgi:hypothetical protein
MLKIAAAKESYKDDAGIDREVLILEMDMRKTDGMIVGDGNASHNDEACLAFS